MEEKMAVVMYMLTAGIGVLFVLALIEDISETLKGKKLRRKKKAVIENGKN